MQHMQQAATIRAKGGPHEEIANCPYFEKSWFLTPESKDDYINRCNYRRLLILTAQNKSLTMTMTLNPRTAQTSKTHVQKTSYVIPRMSLKRPGNVSLGNLCCIRNDRLRTSMPRRSHAKVLSTANPRPRD